MRNDTKAMIITSVVCSVVAFTVSIIAGTKTADMESKIEKAVGDLEGLCSDDISSRIKDGVVQDAIKRAADRKATAIVNKAASDVEDAAKKRINDAIDKRIKDNDISQMLKSRVRKLLSGLTLDQLIKRYENTILDMVKEQITRVTEGITILEL